MLLKTKILNHHQRQLRLAKILVWLGILWASGCAVLLMQNRVNGQIVPDNSLGNESSVVVPDQDIKGVEAELIEGGATRNNNLFHSFSEFNIEASRGAYFANPAGINNIFGRVTGGNVSEILGTLGVLGNADLFLINPNGIIFGADASLDLNGSFLATTADAIGFGEQGFFSADEPNAPPLLTVQPSAFLFNQMNPGTIENRSFAGLGTESEGLFSFGLRVPSGKNITFIGGDIDFPGGGLIAPNGKIQLGGLAAPGIIELDANGNLNIPDNVLQSNILFSDIAALDVSGDRGGSIEVRGNNIDLTENSQILSGITQDSVSSSTPGGDVIVRAANNITLSESGIANQVFSMGVGNTGNIEVQSKTLSLESDSQVETSISGEGNAGDVFINTSDLVELEGGSTIASKINLDAIGNGGDIFITTGTLSYRGEEGFNQVSTRVFNQGNAGNINIAATKEVALDGSGFIDSGTSFGIGDGGDIHIDTGSFSMSAINAIGALGGENSKSGNVTINARESITLDGGSGFSTITNGARNINSEAGDITLNTGSLFLTGLASIDNSTVTTGDAGNINITASDRIEIDDSLIFSRARLIAESDNSPEELGQPGNINISAKSLLLNNGSEIVTEALGQGDGGNINLQIEDLVLLRNQSLISAIAGEDANSGANLTGGGGNIEIQTQVLAAIPNENSDIIANASGGRGGRININTRNILGFETNTQLTPQSDITAFSELNPQLNGEISFSIAETEIISSSSIPSYTTISTEVSQVCKSSKDSDRNEFTVVGRGGLSESPTNTLSSDHGWEDWGEDRSSDRDNENRQSDSTLINLEGDRSSSIVEAQSWIVNDRGNVALVASTKPKIANHSYVCQPDKFSPIK